MDGMMHPMAGVYRVSKMENYKAMMPVESGFIVKGDARRIVPVTISGKQYLLVTVNNGNLQLFQNNNPVTSWLSTVLFLDSTPA